VRLVPHKEDRRNKLIQLTKKGEKLQQEAAKIPELMFCQMQLSLSELTTIKKLTEKLRSHLNAK